MGGPTQRIATDRHWIAPATRPSTVHGPLDPPKLGPEPGPERVRLVGRFFEIGGRKIYLSGVTYGTFRPDDHGVDYPAAELVERDFTEMVDAGFNAIRTYTAPPRWLLDVAGQAGLHVLVGLPWAQHVAFLEDRKLVRGIRANVRHDARACAGHPALLGFTVGNEVPAPIVRWLGRGRVERFITDLCSIVHEEDPGALVTYVNYPTTEYLELPGLDFLSFNVYLEREETLQAYLARLHNLAGDRPLVMAEIGLDSLRNGTNRQARALRWQVETSLQSGCAGAFLFSWTDEWFRGGAEIEDWAFGLTTRDREPKPALQAVSDAFREVPFGDELGLPEISVVVCTYNGSRTIRQTLEHLSRLAYPDFEVIVVDDGSTDHTPGIVREFDVRVISTENRGLSSARNTGAEAARGEVVAYIDDDAYPDPHWLHYLGRTFRDSDFAAVGGPNVLPPGSGLLAECVKHAPGAPTHVLITDSIAEHLPGCNLAVRKSCWREVGGFDPSFRAAGDDVDLCWRLQARGWELGFHPGAVVHHHCRGSFREYWSQQLGYGKAEAMLEEKWPDRYNAAGHLSWEGRLYGAGFHRDSGWGVSRIYFGRWGSAPFQALYHPGPNLAFSVAMMPEWHLIIWLLILLSVLGLFWQPLLMAIPGLFVAVALPVAQAIRGALRAQRGRRHSSGWNRLKFVAITACLHLGQPIGRLVGRFSEGLTPWRTGRTGGLTLPRPFQVAVWSEVWRSPTEWVTELKASLAALGVAAADGGPCDRWDLEARGGLAAAARVLMTVEEHGSGTQHLRFRIWPTVPFPGLLAVIAFLLLLSILAAVDGSTGVASTLVLSAWSLLGLILYRLGTAQATVQRAVERLNPLGDPG